MNSTKTENLFGIRLGQARAMRGLSMRDLGVRMGGVVSAAALGKYEKGLMRPSRVVLEKLCEVLGTNEDFFARPLRVRIGEVKFRKRSRLGVKEERAVREMAEDFFNRYAELEELLWLKVPFENPIREMEIRTPEDVESAAEAVRAEWGLGSGPIPSVMALLESQHVLVYAEDLPEEFDGFAAEFGDRVAVALNTAFSADRRRFSALHELGHVLLRFAEGRFDERAIEKLCHRFAGAMLMPQGKFREDFGGRRLHVAVGELVKIKETWGISCAAIMSRAGALECVSDSTLQRFWPRWSDLGFRTKDPGSCEFPEKPVRFGRLLQRALAEERISVAKGAVLAGCDEAEFREKLEILP